MLRVASFLCGLVFGAGPAITSARRLLRWPFLTTLVCARPLSIANTAQSPPFRNKNFLTVQVMKMTLERPRMGIGERGSIDPRHQCRNCTHDNQTGKTNQCL